MKKTTKVSTESLFLAKYSKAQVSALVVSVAQWLVCRAQNNNVVGSSHGISTAIAEITTLGKLLWARETKKFLR